MSALHRQMYGKPPPGRPSPDKVSSSSKGKGRPGGPRNYEATPWSEYFEECRDVIVTHDDFEELAQSYPAPPFDKKQEPQNDISPTEKKSDTFRVYLSGYKTPDGDGFNTPTLVLLHGGGYSALTWALFTKEIRYLCRCNVLAIDMRGHGSTITSDDEDLSSDTLVKDVGAVIKAVHKDWAGLPPLVLIGHSMGGAIAARCAAQLHDKIETIIGLMVIDVVEGTAMDALQSMYGVLSSRPKSFPTLKNAIEWSLRSGQTRNPEAARISMPGQLKNSFTGQTATCDIKPEISHAQDDETMNNDENDNSTPDDSQPVPKRVVESIMEEEEPEEEEDPIDQDEEEVGPKISAITVNEERTSPSPSTSPTPPMSSSASSCGVQPNKAVYEWRIDLKKTDKFWTGWFEGLSEIFLNAPVSAKFLLLAGIDRLDRSLTIGQMQGKFQMQVLPAVGHAIHEDAPDRVAEAVATFLVRNRFTQALNQFTPSFPGC